MKIVIIDKNKYYLYGIEHLLINTFRMFSKHKINFYHKWNDVDKNTDIVFLSSIPPTLHGFYRKKISRISNRILTLFITDDLLLSHISAQNKLNRLTLWRGESVLYVKMYMEYIFMNKKYLTYKHVKADNSEISENLTPVERRLVILLSGGYSLKKAGEIMGVKKNALYYHKYSIMKKKSLKNKHEFNKFIIDVRHLGILF